MLHIFIDDIEGPYIKERGVYYPLKIKQLVWNKMSFLIFKASRQQ